VREKYWLVADKSSEQGDSGRGLTWVVHELILARLPITHDKQ
jgi:hypothetical protein